VASYSLVCDVLTQMSNAALRELFEVLPKVLKHNTTPAMLMLGTACMTFHYGIVLSTKKCFPVPLTSGCSGTRKTLALRCALALYGAHNKHVYQHCTLQYYTSRCSESSIPFGIDEPSHSKELGELMLSVFNGTMTGNITRGSHRPQLSPVIAANFSLQELHLPDPLLEFPSAVPPSSTWLQP